MTDINNIISNISHIGIDKITECEIMQENLIQDVSMIVKFCMITIPIFIIIQWYAIGKVINSGETLERKKMLIEFILTFTNGMIILFSFIMIYWTFIGAIDF